MSSFREDSKWQIAKKLLNQNYTWLEVISYYKAIGGKNVLVYSVIDGEKRLIVDLTEDNQVLLANRHGELVTDTYENVLNSRKVFEYSDRDSIERKT